MLFASDTATESVVAPVDESAPITSPMAEHDMGDHGMNHDHSVQQTSEGGSNGGFTDINTRGSFHGSNHNSEHNELVGGRTAITTEALLAYNGLRAFADLDAVEIEVVGKWAFPRG